MGGRGGYQPAKTPTCFIDIPTVMNYFNGGGRFSSVTCYSSVYSYASIYNANVVHGEW